MRRILFVIFGLAGLAILLFLGTWQVQRLTWKQEILATIESRIAGEAIALPVVPDPVADKYQPVQLDGTFAEGELHVLVSVKRVGPGYRIIAPFVTTEGRRILVDRGFVATELKNAERPVGAAVIVGNLHWPEEVDGYTPEADKAGNIWFAREVPEMAEALGTEPVLVIARDPIPGSGVTPLPVDTAGIPNDHLQYAITWFSLAVVWAAMIVYFLRRSRNHPKG